MASATSIVLAVCLLAAGGPADGPPPASPAPALSPPEYALMPPDTPWVGKKHPVAVLLAPDASHEEIAPSLDRLLAACGFYSLRFDTTTADRQCIRVCDVLEAVSAAARSAPIDADRILLIAAGPDGETAMSFLEMFHRKAVGVVLFSAAPIRRGAGAIHLWSPPEQAWSVPIWVVVGTDPSRDATTLLMWRRMAASAPSSASFTIDTVEARGGDAPEADPAIKRWLEAIAAGKKPAPGPDRQADGERQRYAPLVERLLEAMSRGPVAPAGEGLAKQEAQMVVRLTAPAGWTRQALRERACDAESSPYVQMYLASPQRRPFFARACAVKCNTAAPEEVLDDYNQRLAQRGFLVVRYRRWGARKMALEVSSVLWPTEQKWHRWLVLAGAGGAEEFGSAAAMVLIMDASERPDVAAMAGAAKRILSTIDVRWEGTGRGRPDMPRVAQPAQLGAR